MTEFQKLLAALEARGRAAARAARDRAAAALLAAAAAELPRIAVAADGDDVVLRGPGVRQRAYGSRTAPPDARLQSLVRR